MQKKLQKGQERRREGQVRQAGQGLVEYALVLVLVAVVCIAIMFATGLSIQRVYGLIAGALGTKHDADYQGEQIAIDLAICYLVPEGYPGHATGLTSVRIDGHTNVPIDQLTLATDNVDVNGKNNLEDLGGGQFGFRPQLKDALDP